MKQILLVTLLLISVRLFAQKEINTPLCSLSGHTDVVKSLVINGDGTILLSGGLDKKLKFWDLTTATLISTSEAPEPIGKVIISPNSDFFAYSPYSANKETAQKQATAWKTRDKTEAMQFIHGSSVVQCVAFSKDGKFVATGDRLGDVRVIDIQNQKEVYKFQEKNTFISTLAFWGENDKYLAIGGDKSLRLWDYAAKESESIGFNTGGEMVEGLSVSPDNKFIATVGNGAKVEMFDLTIQKRRKMPDLNYEPFSGAIHDLKTIAYSKDGNLLAAAGIDGIVYIWQANSGVLIARLKGHTGFIWSLAFSPDNRYLFSGGADKVIKMWDITEFTFVKRALPTINWVSQVDTAVTDSLRKTIRFSIHSFYPLKDIIVFQNDKRLEAKFEDKGTLKRLYNLNFELVVKENSIRVEASNEAGQVVSSPKMIIFIPPAPQINWVTPNNNMTTKEETIRVQFCINSPIPLLESKLYHNGTAIPDENVVRVAGSGACSFMASATLKLVPGRNIVYLGANNGGKWGQSEDKEITYIPPAPTIEWVTPIENIKTTDSTANIKLCINSVLPIKSYSIEHTRTRGMVVKKVDNEKMFKGSCAGEQYIATISLYPYDNILRLKVATEYDTAYSNKIIITRTIPKDSSKSWTGTYYAILIGENTYDDSGIQDLQNPAKDADSIASVLTRLYSFEKENVFVLKDATKRQILKQIGDLTKKVQPEDKLLIFYAGHGIEKDKIGFFLPSDADRSDFLTWISSDELLSVLKHMKTQHTLLIADACYSGSFLMRGTAENDICDILENKPSRRAITSGAAEEVPDQSVFVHYLLQTLTTSPDPCFGSSNLLNRFKDNVTVNSPNRQIPQEGSLHNTGHEGGDFIFHKK